MHHKVPITRETMTKTLAQLQGKTLAQHEAHRKYLLKKKASKERKLARILRPGKSPRYPGKSPRYPSITTIPAKKKKKSRSSRVEKPKKKRTHRRAGPRLTLVVGRK